MADCPECGAKLDPAQSACPRAESHSRPTASFSPSRANSPSPRPAADGREGPDPRAAEGARGGRDVPDRPAQSCVIGRDPSCDIFLNDVTVSRDHAVIEAVGDDIVVRDSGSLNGTYVNDGWSSRPSSRTATWSR